MMTELNNKKEFQPVGVSGGHSMYTEEEFFLRGTGIVTWSELDDLALKKPEDSPEFLVL